MKVLKSVKNAYVSRPEEIVEMESESGGESSIRLSTESGVGLPPVV
jgi:hypothetical protein